MNGSSTGAETRIRLATVADIGPVAALVALAAVDQTELDTSYRTRSGADWTGYVRSRINSNASRLLVAEDAAATTLIGFIELRLIRPGSPVHRPFWRRFAKRRTAIAESDLVERKEPYGFITNIFVMRERRRAGIATALLLEAFVWLKQAEVRDVEAGVLQENMASLALFGKHGFATSRLLLRKRIGS